MQSQNGISFDTWLSIFGIFLGLALYYFDIKKTLHTVHDKVVDLANKKEGILTKQQAHDLVDLYLDATETHLELFLRRYAANDLPEQYAAQQFGRIENEFRRAYDQIVSRSTRKMVASFNLRGDHRLVDLIKDVSQDSVKSALDAALQVMKDCQAGNLPIDEAIAHLLALVKSTNNAGRTLIVNAIDKLYPTTSNH